MKFRSIKLLKIGIFARIMERQIFLESVKSAVKWMLTKE